MRRVDTAAVLAAVQGTASSASSADSHLAFLQRLSERLQRVGLSFPGVEVRWQDLQAEVEVPSHGPRTHTVLSALLAGLDSALIAPMKSVMAYGSGSGARVGAGPKSRVVLDAGSGRLTPGRMCLLLGPPGAGKTTLLRILAGQALPAAGKEGAGGGGDGGGGGGGRRTTGGLHVGGKLLYNGLIPGSDFTVERSASYISQHDLHIGEMTVEETLMFAAECLGPGLNKGKRRERKGKVSRKVTKTHLYTKTHNSTKILLHPYENPINPCQRMGTLNKGNAAYYLQKYVDIHTCAELHDLLLDRERAAGISPDPDLDLLWSTAYGPHGHTLMVEPPRDTPQPPPHKYAHIHTHIHTHTLTHSSPPPSSPGEMAVGFAQVMMLDEVTNGLDSNSAFAIIKSLRNICQYAQATMLVSLLQPSPEVYDCFDDVMLLSGGRLVFLGPRAEVAPFFARLGLAPPPTKTEPDFLQEVTATPEYQLKYRVQGGRAESCGQKWLSPRRLRQEFDRSPPGQQLAHELAVPPYNHELQDMVLHKECYALSPLRMWMVVAARELLLFLRNRLFFVAGAVQILFTAFLVSTTFIRLSKSTFNDANLHMSVAFFSLMTMLMRLAVFFKQRDHRSYSPLVYAVSCFVMRLPELLVQSSLWCLMVYFSTGFVEDAGRFFIFWLNLVVAGLYSVSVFQLLGAVTRHEVIAQVCVRHNTAWHKMHASLIVSVRHGSIPPWWIWFYWCNPMAWALRSMVINELTAAPWGTPAVDFGRPDITIGQYSLLARGFYTEWRWVWAGIGTVMGLSLVLLVLQVVALNVASAPSTYRPPLDEEEEEEEAKLRRQDDNDNYQSPYNDQQELELAAGQVAAVNGRNGNDNNVTNGNNNQKNEPIHIRICVKSTYGPQRSSPAESNGGDANGETANNSDGCGANGNGNGNGHTKDLEALEVHRTTHGSNLSFSPVVMTFKGINYFVPEPKGKGELQLLRDVGGVFLPGVLTSLMGASGAGKTTLMDVLAGRKTGGRQEGEQLVNGAPKRMAAFARVMGYVEQFDAHNPQATVEEALLFSARLRVPPGVLSYTSSGGSRTAIRAHVAEVMEVVELGPLARHAVGAGGAVGGGLSTEARKRLTIACELVANPSIMFLDEPTTGLDARAAGMVMRAVRNTVATGRTVVCTIHQPNREIMDYFDELLLLKPGGRVIFNGPVGRPNQSELIAYLESIPGVPRSSLLGVLDIMGALFSTALFLAMTNCLTIMPVTMSERAVFYRERASGMYSSVVFAAAQGLAEFPYLFVQSVVYVIIVYCTTQFEFDSSKALWFWLFIWLNLLCFTYLGMGCMNLTPNMPACVAMTSFAVLLWMLFCGFLIYKDDIKPWWLWAYYFNPATYSIYGCIVTQLGDVTDEQIAIGQDKYMSVADFVDTTFGYKWVLGWGVGWGGCW
ncbi:hypothetical protein VOLCADRAFT_93195 [Volvox carteri f. nagariensis]|uniref:ABC transporter domain-containing protein n=1 Tax=Volvox carteri f. nagariensis TaxID=3068 RepID=D8U1J3_VOLCA|nr:uncharacterized protein VOLCADRAFT_93195 [Volvox carteri f. nagariensis]EFJ46421.1 hypothetical protein VOLCADRAFT_93195 [Volvox carteri f. nagariensis]|eukprot:XP_002952574.1 hypothetical protein VOLCADRAFT_93195 [Volvox carteri f. nagariensis]